MQYFRLLLQMLDVVARIMAKLTLERLEGVGIIVKTAAQAGVSDRDAVAQHIACDGQAFFHNELIERQACILLELIAEVILADVESARKAVERQVFGQVIVDVGNDLIDLFIFRNVMPDGVRRVEIRAVEVHQKLQQAGIQQGPAAEMLLGFDLCHISAMLLEAGEQRAVRPDELVFFAGRVVEAGGKIIAPVLKTREKVILHPDDITLIRLAGGDDRTVDIAAAGQQNIARAQLIGTAFNDIINVSRQEKEDFVERMLVKFHIRRNAVKVVMKLKIFFLHELPRSKFFFMYIQ